MASQTMASEKASSFVIDDVRFVSAKKYLKHAGEHRPEDEPTVEMTQAEVEEMLRKASRTAERSM